MTVPDTIFQYDQSDIADGMVAGDYLHHRRGHVSLPVRVWWGQPPAVQIGDVMDRAPRWMISVAGVILGDDRYERPMAQFADVWPRCLGARTTDGEVDYRQARIEHARQHDMFDPFGDARGRIDLLTAPVPF